MSNPAYVPAASPVAVIPTPSCIRPRQAVIRSREAALEQAAVTAAPDQPGAGDAGARRSAAREGLQEALAGIQLGSRDSSFLSRLVHWDKRNAASVASLLSRARQAGREEAGLTPRQQEVIVAALRDAAIYRAAGHGWSGCWDCENVPGGRCADHAKDHDRARSYAELAATLSGTPAQMELPRPRTLAGYRRRTPVAS